MNERIKELVKQSGGEFWQRLENDVVNTEAYITFDPPESLEKFAELLIAEFSDIVKQTAILVAQTAYSDGESKADVDRRVAGALRVLEVMRERFKD